MIAPLLALALQGGTPLPSPPLPPVPGRPPKAWTAEEVTTPILDFECDLIDHQGRAGKLAFVVTGGRGYPEPRADRQQVRSFGRTEQHVEFKMDDLKLLPRPEASEVSVWPSTGKFFVRLTAADPPPVAYGSRTRRSVFIDYNYGMRLAISVNAVPRAPLATGFCSVRTQPQAPLSREEAARETAT